MESSSDESFTWGKVSNASDDSTDSTSNTPYKAEDIKCENNLKNVNNKGNSLFKEEKSKKRKKGSMSDEDSIGSPRKKSIKIEPSSDNDIQKTKSKKKIKMDTCHSEEHGDETFLHTRVKEEVENLQKHITKKKKKKHHNSDSNVSLNSSNELESGLNNEIYIEKKSKKKKRRSDLETDPIMSDVPKSEEIPKNRKYSIKEVTTDDIHTHFNKVTEELKVASNQINGNERIENGMDTSDIRYDSDDKSTQDNNLNDESFKTKVSKYYQNGIDEKHKETTDKSFDNSHQQKEQTQPRILDRIQFEDDVDSEMELQKKNKQVHSSKLKNFLKENTILQQSSENIENMFEITKDDEIWILKCPHDIDVENFNNKDLTLDSKSKIKINGETYCGTLDEERSRITIMSNEEAQYTIKNIEINGMVCFRKRLPKPHIVEDNVMVNNQTDFIPLPDTKCRHPLFGSNYKNAIKIPNSLSQRLNLNTSVHSERKKRKKHKINPVNTETDEEILRMNQPEPEIIEDIPVKKAKKRKHNNDDEHITKKAKKIKREIDSSAVWESEKAIEENLFNF